MLDDDGIHVVVRAPWAGAATRDMGFVRFEEGDVLTEHFWRDRWYSSKEVRDGAGALVLEDLDLDLWLSADRGTILRLD